VPLKEVNKMPRGDGTGPWGQGSMTGRGLGYCSGYERPGFITPGPGMGLGRGMGAGWTPGRGMGRGRGMGMGRGRFCGFQGYPYPQMMPYGTPPHMLIPKTFPNHIPKTKPRIPKKPAENRAKKNKSNSAY